MIKVLSLLFVLTVASLASAQTYVESQNQIIGSTLVPTIDAQLEVPGKGVNVYGWFQVSQTWGEALIGVSKQLNSAVWVSIAAGVETDEHPWRISPSVSFSKNRVSIFATTEHGGSGFWYKSMGTVRVAGQLEVGLHSQRFYGTGPMVRLTFSHKVAVWASVVKGSTIIGISKVL